MKTDLWIEDPGLPTRNNANPLLPPRIAKGWLYKRKEETALNEVVGYQLAVAMRVPVPIHRFFVVTSHDPDESLVDDTNDSPRVGLLIKEISGPKTHYSNVLHSDADAGMRHLGLRLFSTSECPELIQTEQGALAIDLEFVLGHLAVPSLDSPNELNNAIKSYREQTRHEFCRCYQETEQFGLCDRFLKTLKEQLILTHNRFSPNFTPLAKGRLIEEFYWQCFEARKSSLMELMELVC